MSPEMILTKECIACPKELGKIRQDVANACHKMGFSNEDCNAVVLAIDEACTNIIRYAYKDCSDGKIVLEIFIENKQAVFLLQDHAPKVPNDCIDIKQIDPLKPGGLGVMLIRKVMDSVKFIDTAEFAENVLEMRKDLPQEKTTK